MQRKLTDVVRVHRAGGAVVVGAALVVWDANGASTCWSSPGHSIVTTAALPEFVSTRLRLEDTTGYVLSVMDKR